MSHPFRTATLVVALSALVPGCFTDQTSPLPDDFGVCVDQPAVPDFSEQLLTYYGDVKPIIDAKCEGCHREGEVGPFPLTTFDDVFQYKDGVRLAVAGGSMPPWQPDDCCNHYRWDRSMSAEQRAMLIEWVDQGALMGNPDEEAPPIEVDRGGLERVDLTLTMAERFAPVPTLGQDEIRCFAIDWPYDDDMFVTGMNLVPTERRIVHHAVIYTVDRETADELRKLDGADGRPGWDCWGEFVGKGQQPTGSVGGWAPGYQGVTFPEGFGRKVPAGSAIILNMHYNMAPGQFEDQTSLDLMVEEEVEGELVNLGMTNPIWLIRGSMSIEAGDPDEGVFFSYDPTTLFSDGQPFHIYSVNHHMHALGTVGRVAVLRADGSVECLLNITDWDFSWIGEYYLEEPVEIRPGDKIFLECRWDNSAGNQVFVDGERQEPRDITWSTDEEMCAVAFSVHKP